MKYNFLVLIFIFVVSCNTAKLNKEQYIPFSQDGFAIIYNISDFNNKIISHKLDENKLEIGHNKLKKNTILLITNPKNNKRVEIKVTKKMNYPDFFTVMMTEKVSEKLGLDKNIPYVSINERLKSKSFIAEKAITHTEEQKVSNKAPITAVKIKNISKENAVKVKISQKYSILVAEFYSENAAKELLNFLEKDYVKKGSLRVKKINKDRYELSSYPFTSINALKKLYFELKKYGFEDLDIKQND